MPQGGHWKMGTAGCLGSAESVCRGTASGAGIRFGKKNPRDTRADCMAGGKAARYSLGDWLVSNSVFRIVVDIWCECNAGSVARFVFNRIRGVGSSGSVFEGVLPSSSAAWSGVLLFVVGELGVGTSEVVVSAGSLVQSSTSPFFEISPLNLGMSEPKYLFLKILVGLYPTLEVDDTSKTILQSNQARITF